MSEWLKHVKATMRLNKGLPLKEVLKIAKTTYKTGEKAVKETGKVIKYAVTGKKKHKKHHKKSQKKHHKKSQKKHHKKSQKKHHKKSHRGKRR